MKKLMLSLLSLSFLVSCETTTCTDNCTVYTPTPYYTCDWIYDTWSNNYTYACFWVYYSADGVTQELDMVADIADKESLVIEKSAQVYAEKFSLSTEQATKIAKNVYHLNALEERTAADLADFAQKLYGVNPAELISAISSAQVGNNEMMDTLIEKAANEFATSKANMKAIIKDLHHSALEQSGIKL